MATIAEILAQVHDLQLTPEEALPQIQVHVDAAAAAAANRDSMAMAIVQGMLAGRADTNLTNLIDQAYTGADAMCARRSR